MLRREPRRGAAGDGATSARDEGRAEWSGGHAALAELREALATDEAPRDRQRDLIERGERAERPVPLDEQVGAMAGEAPLGRLRRAPVERRRNPPGSQVAADPIVPLALSDFHDLRRLGLFGDDGRNPPPSWWAR